MKIHIKKYLALMLSAAMIATLFTGCKSSDSNGEESVKTQESEESEKTDTAQESETLSFSVLTIDDDPEFMEWPLVKEAKEKFHIEFTNQLAAWDSWDETFRTLAATDSLPEVIAWYNLKYSEYASYVEQGVFKPFPEDLSAYPNIKKRMESYSVCDDMKIDGVLYAMPKTINENPYNEYSPSLIVYRKDWAKALGYDFDDVQELSWEEFVDYLTAVKTKDPGALGDNLVPFDFYHGGQGWLDFVSLQWNPYLSSNTSQYEKTDSGYMWGAKNEKSLQGILEFKKLYDSGLIYQDSYADTSNSGLERFLAGRVAVFHGPLTIPTLQDLVLTPACQSLGLSEEDFGIFCVTWDGKFQVREKSQWWGAYAFSSNCSDEIMDRWLRMGDWLLEKEQIEKANYGVEGEDWTREGDTITLNWTEDQLSGDKSYIKLQENFFRRFFVLEGDPYLLEDNPRLSPYFNDIFKQAMETYATKPNYYPVDYDVSYFSGEAFDVISGSLDTTTGDAVIRSVIADNPKEVWEAYLSDMESQTQAAADELTAALCQTEN